MPTTNFDASELTRKRRAMVLYGFKQQLDASNSVRPEQTQSVTLDVVTARKQGGCYCTALQNEEYNKNSCGCGGTNQ
jgi:hypothetical protein